MIAQNTMKINGKWFYAGQEIEGAEDSALDFYEYTNQPETDMPYVNVPSEKRHTKTEIYRMSTAELKEFAAQLGIENANDLTGGEIKKILVDKLGL